MRRRVVSVTTIALVWLMLLQPTSAMASPCWQPPVSGTVVVPFRAPACWYCAGHRGIEYGVTRSTVVRAVAAGTVTYSGTITGVMYVVVRHANGWKITYAKLLSSNLLLVDVGMIEERLCTGSHRTSLVKRADGAVQLLQVRDESVLFSQARHGELQLLEQTNIEVLLSGARDP